MTQKKSNWQLCHHTGCDGGTVVHTSLSHIHLNLSASLIPLFDHVI